MTFPFFFGIMFGDYGHGSLIFFVGLILTLFSDKIKNTVFAPALAMRYVLLMMGACSMYNGLIYNEFFSIPNDWFGTCFELTQRQSKACVNCVYPPRVEAGKHFVWNGATVPAVRDPKAIYSSEYQGNDCVYPFGTDPAWFLSPQYLTFVNSIKMRSSVIIGVLHMSMGIIVKGFNACFKGQNIVFWFEVVAGLIILNGLFGWMDFLILSKWLHPMNAYSTDPKAVEHLRSTPSIITVMINNFLKGGNQDVYFFDSQKTISNLLLMFVVIAVPLMLCVKPIIFGCCLKVEHKEDEFEKPK